MGTASVGRGEQELINRGPVGIEKPPERIAMQRDPAHGNPNDGRYCRSRTLGEQMVATEKPIAFFGRRAPFPATNNATAAANMA